MRERLREILGEVGEPVRLAGGASKEAWAVDGYLVRRAGGGVIHSDTLTLEQEFSVLRAAHEAGVTVPRPIAYIADLDGREAFAMERLEGEAIGRRIVRLPELERARAALPLQMAEELARIHAIAPGALPFLPAPGIETLEGELDGIDEAHPAIELGLRYLHDRAPAPREPVVCHGDFRVGNLIVGPEGLVGVLDWEFAHLGSPAQDLAWPLVRAWRFGADRLRVGGLAGPEPYLTRYNELTRRGITPEELDYWELAGNVHWAIGSLTQARRHLSGQERSVELAILGRLAAEVEYEVLHLLERAA